MPAHPVKPKAELIDQVAARLRASATEGDGTAVEQFARRYYQDVAPDLLLEQPVETLAAAALSLWRFVQRRAPGAPKLRVYNPNHDEHGWNSTHTVIEIANDDMPFIVDSVVAALNRQNLIVHLLIHPVIRVRRDKDGKLVEVLDRAGKEGSDESVLHVEVNQRGSQAALDAIRDTLSNVLVEVRAAVEDWSAMRARMDEVLASLDRAPPPTPPDERVEDRAFLEWMRDHNFTFLGARDYALEKKGGKEYLRIVPNSGLGLLRKVTPESAARHDTPLTPTEALKAHVKSLLIITKAASRSTVHRAVYMDYIGVRRFDAKGNASGERRFVGLFTSSAYNRNPREIPLLRRKVQQVLDRTGFAPASHNAKAILHILETYPRDELFQIGVGDLYDTAMGVLHLEERQRLRLFVRRDEYARFYSCLVYVPREAYSTELRYRIEKILRGELKGESVDFNTHISDAPMARVHYMVRSSHGVAEDVDVAAVEARLAAAARRWSDDLVDHLTQRLGEARAHELFDRYRGAFPPGYQYRFDAEIAVADIERIETVRAGAAIAMNLYRRAGAAESALFFKIFHAGTPLALSDVLPMLEHMGLKVIAERPFEISADGHPVFVHDFEMAAGAAEIDLGAVRDKFQDAFQRIWAGEAESDGLNRLIMRAGFDWREVVVLRTYVRYLRQVRAPYSQALIEDTLAKNAGIARLLVDLFEARLDPDRTDSPRGGDIVAKVEAALDAVTSLEEDSILRRLLNLVVSTLRTNHFQRLSTGAPKPYLSVKLDSHKIDDLPLPRPMVEIFVYSAHMEGVHLRGGKVARGGIRWSDRREDFRTEILGLMKAQMVKNAVIVPVGSKGGFVLKRPPSSGGREALQAEVVRCYQTLIRGMLDLTDNRKGAGIVPPARVVRYDGDDPYLVVAADKGTATFSDIANALAREYGFWLDDAFASGGSAGYDHKEMAITARGGWVSVQRHFRELGVDVQKQEFTCVGVGDMSGDVFGNGALRSDRMKLLGAFNHLHIFVDPDPDPAKSFAERTRLFGLPRSSWSDYDTKLISKGGGVYARDLKSISLSPEAKARFDIGKDHVTPSELMNAILKAKVDLIWFGGIGTYVKASQESHLEVGDRANDAIRVDGRQLRARVVGEGANLGCTQRGRVEYAQAGGRINTDAIDNSGGVDCSDHEVNIKILLGEVVAGGDMTMKQRDALLVKMTDEVADLVLKDNYQQTQAISIMEARSQELLDQQARMMTSLEREGRLDRTLEFLPDEETVGRRRAANLGLTRPEIAIMLAYGKIALYDDLLASNLPDDPLLFDDLVSYFPTPVHGAHKDALEGHRLRREIVAMVVTNSVINRVGASFVHDAQERTGLGAADVARAYTITRDAFDIRGLWRPIEKLDNKVPAALQIEMMREVGKLVERSIYWFLRNGSHPLDVAATAAVFRPGITALARGLEGVLTPERDARFRAHAERLVKAGVPENLARRVACLEEMGSACDLVRIARLTQQRIETAAEVYFALSARLGFHWLRNAARAMKTETAWQKNAVDAVIDDLRAQQSELTVKALGEAGSDGDTKAAIEAWLAARTHAVKRIDALLAEFKATPAVDIAMLAVASRRLRTLAGA